MGRGCQAGAVILKPLQDFVATRTEFSQASVDFREVFDREAEGFGVYAGLIEARLEQNLPDFPPHLFVGEETFCQIVVFTAVSVGQKHIQELLQGWASERRNNDGLEVAQPQRLPLAFNELGDPDFFDEVPRFKFLKNSVAYRVLAALRVRA